MMINEPATFLYTDIESSTQLWEQHPEAMKIALAKHHAILRKNIENNHGRVYKIIGDAFCAVFEQAADALSAAMKAQQALYAETWNDTPIKVRMALHTGVADTQDGDYSGPMFNRLARILSAGHGGQTLLSAATYALVASHLPPETDLRDMGERRLRGLARAENIYQLRIQGLPTLFPPLKTLDAFRTNLPAQLTSFIGREKEMAAVKHLIRTSRLTTLTGPGGTGKTRLSLQVAADLLDSFPDEVWFVELAPLSDPALVPQTVMNTIGLHERADRSPLNILGDYLQSKADLLILDNCEHVVQASAELSETLLQNCPKLHIIASSREILGVPGETSYRVPSLSIPNTHHPHSIETAMQSEAVQLFIARAKVALPTFTITNQNIAAITQICSRLDGIPLAIELAAARIKILRVEQIAERLDDRFLLLTGGSRTALPRQQTLRALIDWSYNLLPEPERVLLQRLSVFSGGWTLEAAEQVCAKKDKTRVFDVLDSLEQLVNKSLVISNQDDITIREPLALPAASDGEIRYHLLETVRQYAREKLFENNEGSQTRDQHLAYFLALAKQAELELTGPHTAKWLRRLEVELDNIRVALEWSQDHDPLSGLQLASALLWFWEESGYSRNGWNWLKQLLNRPDTQAPTLVRARALGALAYLLAWNGSIQETHPIIEENLALCQKLGDRQGIALSLQLLGLTKHMEDYEQAWQLVEESLHIYQELGDKFGMGWALTYMGGCLGTENNEIAHNCLQEGLIIFRELQYSSGAAHILMHLGELALRRGDYIAARSWLEEGLSMQNPSWHNGNIFRMLATLGILEFQTGNYAKARALAEKSITMNEQNGDSSGGNYWPWVRLAYISLREGDIMHAKELFEESLHNFKEVENTIGIVYTLEGMASLAVAIKQFKTAAQIFAWADRTRETIHDRRSTVEQNNIDLDLTTIHAHLNETDFIAAQTIGQAMTIEQAIACALTSD